MQRKPRVALAALTVLAALAFVVPGTAAATPSPVGVGASLAGQARVPSVLTEEPRSGRNSHVIVRMTDHASYAAPNGDTGVGGNGGGQVYGSSENCYRLQLCAWARKTIYVEDHTGSAWPVTNAVQYFNDWTVLNIVYGACAPYQPCIRTHERNWPIGTPGGGRIGQCGWSVDSSTGFRTGVADLDFNDVYAGVPLERRKQTAKHELGHCVLLNYHRFGADDGVMLYWMRGASTNQVLLRADQEYIRDAYAGLPN